MRSIFVFSLLVFVLGPLRVDLTFESAEVGAQENMKSIEMSEKSEGPRVLRDPFLDPEWAKKKREEEGRRRVEERRRREAERKKQVLKLRGIVQVGQRSVAIIDGKTLRAGDVIRGRRILEVNRSGIRLFYRGKVRSIFWKPKRQLRRLR